MAGTTQTHINFVSGPVGNKPITALPGIGPILGERLAEAGYGQAYSVIGQFLVLNKDEVAFKNWLYATTQANANYQQQCYYGVSQWCYNYM